KLNTVVNLGMLGKISSYPTYPIAVILKMAMHLEDPERTGRTPAFTNRTLDRFLPLLSRSPRLSEPI
ncbi:MAG: hypothetical protein ACXWNF_16160, partial [Isosphaeraceae bacterium]